LISTRLSRTLAAVALGAIAAAPAATGETLHCDFMDTFEAFTAHTVRLEKPDTYDFNIELFGEGTPEAHDRAREAIETLELDPDRTPFVLAALDTGKIHVAYCPDRVCSIEDQWRAQEDCALALQAQRCVVYAIRVEGDLYCTSVPGPPAPPPEEDIQ
jgi:hypothetical protein